MITKIVQDYVNDTKCQKNYNKRINDGKTFNESMKNIKNATAGVLFTRGKVLLDEEVLDHVKSQKKEVHDEANRIVQKTAQVYDTRADFIATKPAPKCHEVIDKMKAVELKHWLQWEKRKKDPAMPSKLADMREQIKEMYERPDLSKEDYLRMMGYDIKQLTSAKSDDNPLHAVINNAIKNEVGVDQTEENLGVLV